MPDDNDLSEGPDHTLVPTRETYDALQLAYDHFNFFLFDNRLPNCLITLQRKGRCHGYFASKRMVRADGAACDEIALNPAHFDEKGVLWTLSVLVHEMVHLWQAYFGTPGRGRYHNLQWGAEMKRIGLYPSNTAMPGGKETGDQMQHFVIKGGMFERAAADLMAGGFEIAWRDARQPRRDSLVDGEGGEDAEPAPKSGKRQKYQCPICDLAAWSRHDAAFKCGLHDAVMTPVD